jgi:hypothetical protein
MESCKGIMIPSRIHCPVLQYSKNRHERKGVERFAFCTLRTLTRITLLLHE